MTDLSMKFENKGNIISTDDLYSAITVIGEHIAVFETEPTWNEQQVPGCANLLCKINSDASELNRSLSLCLVNIEMTINPSFSTTVVQCACLLDSLIHQWAGKLISIELLTREDAQFVDFFKHKILRKLITDYNNLKAESAIDEAKFSFKKQTVITKGVLEKGVDKIKVDKIKVYRNDLLVENRCIWLVIMSHIRDIFVHRGVYLLKSNIKLICELLRPKHVGSIPKKLCQELCVDFLVFINSEIIKLHGYISYLINS